MPTQVLQPGAVTIAENFNTYIPYTIAGDPPQWADASDATYSETWHSVRFSEAKGDVPIAPLDPLTLAGAVTSIVLDARVAWENRDGAERRLVDFEIRTSAGAAVVGFAPLAYDLPDVSGPSDITLDLADSIAHWGTNLAAVGSALAAGADIVAYRYTSGDVIPADYGLTVYELRVTVTTADAPRTLVAPPRRLTQRGDGLAGGAPRLTGSRSQQTSNRLLGGYL